MDQQQESATLLLVDGNSIINRAYYGLGPNARLTAPDGTPTGAVMTFFNILFKYSQQINPAYLLVAFDLKGPTFRHQAFADYKGRRKPMPEDLALQLPVLKQCLDALAYQHIGLQGFEADDIIGSAAAQAEEQGVKVAILTGDKDSFQLIDDQVTVMMPAAGAIKEDQLYDRAHFNARYGIEPEQFVSAKAIMGDSSDNIPGVHGIGEKGAMALIQAYGSLDGVYKHLEELKPAQRSKLEASRDMAYLSLDLSQIKRDLPLPLTLEDCRLQETYPPTALTVLSAYGLQSLIKKLQLDQAQPAAAPAGDLAESEQRYEIPALGLTALLPARPAVVESPEKQEAKSLFLQLKTELSLDESFDPSRLIASVKKEEDPAKVLHYRAAFTWDGRKLLLSTLTAGQLSELLQIFARQELTLTGYDLKAWLRDFDIPEQLSCCDLMSAAYLLSLLNGESDPMELWHSSTGQPAAFMLEDKPRTELEQSLIAEACICQALSKPLLQGIKNAGITELWENSDRPLTLVLARMERRGFLVDQSKLNELGGVFEEQISELQNSIYLSAGHEFNINSTKQLGEVLYQEMGLPSGRKNKGGSYSTAAEELDRLKAYSPIIQLIADFRNLSKLKSTFVDGLNKYIDPRDGRIHSTFSPNFTNTGRLSSRDPNLQNIPVRQEAGREIRKAFVAADGYCLLDADYSQIELRLLAHLSGDQGMITAFKEGRDIHRQTAQTIFGLPASDITAAMRSAAKTVNFSIVYGISDFGLAQDLGLTVKEAHQYIEGYYKEYPAVKDYLEHEISQAKHLGYSQTLFGRRRYIPELKSKNYNIRQFGERVAMNSPIQGTAADIIRMAMVNLDRELLQAGLAAHLVSQVHDELIVEVKLEDAKAAAKILQQAMETVVSLQVPLIAQVKQGRSWFEAKD
ncbi:DNA polymerase I [Oscillospiraceae bacterium HV4-5-C5C]|nr:DNA polymerase I [Oscillospiraceae bacterium HV4-5-C5C]